MIKDKKDAALFAMSLFVATENTLKGMGVSMVWTDSFNSVVTPWGYDDENDPDGLLADLDSRWNPEENFHAETAADLVRAALSRTDILDREEPNITAIANGLSAGALGLSYEQSWKPCDREMLDFAKKETSGLDLYYNVDDMQGGVYFRVSENPAPKAGPKA